MASDTSAFPLAWPVGSKRTARREASRFRLTSGKARKRLLDELGRLGASGIVLSTNVPLRNDGLPYSSERDPDDPGVAVYFHLKGHPHAMSCDRWVRVADNMIAIALTIEAMRGIARWGSQEARDQAFTGFRALPPTPAPPKAPGVDWRQVFHLGESAPVGLDLVKTIYRGMALRYHPDRGGTEADMQRLNAAMEAAEQELRR